MIKIRSETPDDIAAIFNLTQDAFADRPFSNGTEGPIINALRQDGDLSLSLVAENSDEICGHIAVSPVRINGETDGLYALGPVCAHPSLRGQGIGSALIDEALSRLPNVKAVVLIGDPNYYSRFGFVGDCGLTYQNVPPSAVQILDFDAETSPARKGEIIYAPAFDTP